MINIQVEVDTAAVTSYVQAFLVERCKEQIKKSVESQLRNAIAAYVVEEVTKITSSGLLSEAILARAGVRTDSAIAEALAKADKKVAYLNLKNTNDNLYNWLSSRAANALRVEYNNIDGDYPPVSLVAAWFASDRKNKIPNLGKTSIAEIEEWLARIMESANESEEDTSNAAS